VIALYDGLASAFYYVARTLASTVNMTASDDSKETPALLSREEAAKSLYEMFRMQVFAGVPVQENTPITNEHGYLARNLTDMAEKFLYAHEMAHIMLGHDATSERAAISRAFDEGHEIAASADEETEADILGWNLLVRLLLPNDGAINGGDLQMAYAGTRLFLRTAQLLEHAGEVSSADTHPPTADRLQQIAIAAQSTAQDFALPFEMIEAIDNWLQAAMTDLETAMPPLPWKSPIEELLEGLALACKDSFVSPSALDARHSAIREILWLLSFGAPRKLCRELGRTMGVPAGSVQKFTVAYCTQC
jgi:hypothetical protein